jgi:hypothetical protein
MRRRSSRIALAVTAVAQIGNRVRPRGQEGVFQ